MANKSVLCVTWNLELQCPDDQALKDSFVDYIEHADPKPRLIVIGLQEAAAYSAIGEIFVGNKLASNALLGKNYRLIATAHFKGITKGSQFFGFKAQQVLQVLAHKDEKIHVDYDTKSKGKVPGFNEKGFCFARVKLADRVLGFVSTHLSADTDVEKKKKEGANILKYLKEHSQVEKFDALFMMGDLNFRVRQSGAACDLRTVHANLCIPPGRDELMTCDSFTPEAFANLPFIWPAHAPGSVPTYKRKKEKGIYPAIRALKNNLSKTNTSLKNIFPVSSKKDRPGYWDFGWLDRIGYALLAPNQHNMASGCGKPLFNSTLQLANPGVTLQNWYYVPYGDHAPVYCEFVISGF